MNKKGIHILYIFLITALLASCTSAPSKNAETKKTLAPKEDELKSLDRFTEILNLVELSPDRKAVLPEVEKAYIGIINEYPDTPLAQESYWRLIMIYINDHIPPDYEKAEYRYNEFLNKYPRSPLKNFVEEALGNRYYRDAMWKKLLWVSTPAFNKYVDQGISTTPSLMFMYAEANYNLGNFTEAEKGYKGVIVLFPKLNESKKSRARLDEIGGKQ
jgi:outer membrane protein assembly factor BamD (BamD/ComL family)